jgi:hypothetical protein
MQFFETIINTIQYQTITPSLVLFLLSALLLVAGVATKVWSQAVRLSNLEYKPLNWIEREHPHMPSPTLIITIALCSITLIVAALQTMQGVFPFNDPYQGLNITSLFLLGGAVGILAELQWKGAGEYTAAVLVGSAVSFLAVVVKFSNTQRSFSDQLLLFVLLLPSIALAGYAFSSRRQISHLLTALCAFAFWMFVYLLQR